MSSITPRDLALYGRIGAYVTHSRYGGQEITAPARKAFLDKFPLEVDPEHELPEEERHRRAGMARKAYFTRLALKSAVARRRKGSKNSTPAANRTAAIHQVDDFTSPSFIQHLFDDGWTQETAVQPAGTPAA